MLECVDVGSWKNKGKQILVFLLKGNLTIFNTACLYHLPNWLFKKQVLLTSAFFGFCGFSRNWHKAKFNKCNTDFHFLHRNALL